jgi:stage II sporulation protein M
MWKQMIFRIFRPCFARRWICCIVLGCFFCGVVFGWLCAGVVNLNQGIRDFLEANAYSGAPALFYAIASKHVVFLLELAFLGLSLLGLPLLLTLLFVRGFYWGFSFCCLIRAEPWLAGYLKAFLTMVPHNLIALPVILLMACAASNFSIQILQGQWEGDRLNRSFFHSFLGQFGNYLLLTAFLVLFSLGASLIETYLTPLFNLWLGS